MQWRVLAQYWKDVLVARPDKTRHDEDLDRAKMLCKRRKGIKKKKEEQRLLHKWRLKWQTNSSAIEVGGQKPMKNNAKTEP